MRPDGYFMARRSIDNDNVGDFNIVDVFHVVKREIFRFGISVRVIVMMIKSLRTLSALEVTEIVPPMTDQPSATTEATRFANATPQK